MRLPCRQDKYGGVPRNEARGPRTPLGRVGAAVIFRGRCWLGRLTATARGGCSPIFRRRLGAALARTLAAEPAARWRSARPRRVARPVRRCSRVRPGHRHRTRSATAAVPAVCARGRSRHSGGIGLGLSIVRHLLNAHCGSINVERAPGDSSSFVVGAAVLSARGHSTLQIRCDVRPLSELAPPKNGGGYGCAPGPPPGERGSEPPGVSSAALARLVAPGGITLGRCDGAGGASPGTRAPSAFPSGA